ncbi:MAG: Heavy-metal-associated domain protein [Schlesneria sp.]|nr:Heavy-metal-associated domain protein [Schlesneria sp.]
MKNSVVVANVLAWMMACVSVAGAAETPNNTIVSIKGMHCAGCANKVTKKLQAVPNVNSASVDADKGTAVVNAAAGKDFSPKAVWEAIESAGYKPTELKGPTGTFTAKPTK